jgi:acyl-CoA synthetase (AMP-forming)/AMP-acid ligase II
MSVELLGSRLDKIAAKYPNKAAFIFRRGASWETISYKQLVERSNQLACGLQSLGISAGTYAALMVPPGIDFFALTFALVKTGIVPILVDPAVGLQLVTRCLAESKPEIFFGSPLTHLLRSLFGWGKETIKLNITTANPGGLAIKRIRLSTSTSYTPPHISPASPAAIIYTSGSTGLPKGAVYSQTNFAAQIDMLTDTFHIGPDEIDLPAFPLFALIDCLVGVTAIIPDMNFPAPAKVSPRRVIDAINKFSVSNMFASPIMLNGLANYGLEQNIKLTSLKRVITAGAPAPVQVLEKFKKLLPSEACLYGIYGATEALPISVIECTEILTETRFKSAQGAGVCIGRPVENIQVRIIGISDTPISEWSESLELPVNVVGEITVKGPAVTTSYVGRPEADQLAKIRDGEEIVHRMGDLGSFDEQGRLWYCGRKSQRVELSDVTLFTEQIEGIFNAHPLVYRTALVAVDNEPVLWVQPKAPLNNFDKSGIDRELLALGSKYPQAAGIRTFLFLSQFPTDVRHNSKIIREKLATLARKKLA